MDKIFPLRAAFDAYSDWSGPYIKGGDYGVTELLDPPRLVHLRKRHEAELPPEPIAKKWKAFQGNAWHMMCERQLRRANSLPDYYNRFIIEGKVWDRIHGVKIAGKIDAYDIVSKILYDWKVCGTYKAKMKDYEDFEFQLNVYAWFLDQCGFPVEKLVVVAIHPDWDHYSMMRDPLYPSEPMHEVELPLWTFKKQDEFVKARVKALVDTKDLPDDLLPPCSKEDRWVKPSKFALYEPGKDRATRVLSTRKEIEKYIEYRNSKKKPVHPDYKIVERPSEPTRCLEYCRVSGLCLQHSTWLAEQAMEAEED